MKRNNYQYLLILVIFTMLLTFYLRYFAIPMVSNMVSNYSQHQLLTDPFLQLPTPDSINVVWFTEFAGQSHQVYYGENLQDHVEANMIKTTRLRDDADSPVRPELQVLSKSPILRNIWRHEATIHNLQPNTRIPYRVVSINDHGEKVTSDIFSLAPQPTANKPLKILITSDHQLKPMTATNIEKVTELFPDLDAVFFAGDLVNVPDRAADWFDNTAGNSFFPILQGRANYQLTKNDQTTIYHGGKIIQNTPMFTAIGNHEIMGTFSENTSLYEQFDHGQPRWVVEKLYEQMAGEINPDQDPIIKENWLKNHSFNFDTYNEIFTLPISQTGDEKYYATTFGDIRLVVLHTANIWRYFGLGDEVRGKYRERQSDFNQPENWGYGQFIFESIAPGSRQYDWLKQELASKEFRQAKYKIVMFHHPAHSLGGNVVPAYTDPVQIIERDEAGNITNIRYEYPLEQDQIQNIRPLLEEAGVQLVIYGHCHIWNRFISPARTHYLETSNIGNNYGAFWGEKKRAVPTDHQVTYPATGDPYGLSPIIPTIQPLLDEDGQPLPYLASNDLTAFSILDTELGTVSSYYFDTRQPNSAVIKFDEFYLSK